MEPVVGAGTGRVGGASRRARTGRVAGLELAESGERGGIPDPEVAAPQREWGVVAAQREREVAVSSCQLLDLDRARLAVSRFYVRNQ